MTVFSMPTQQTTVVASNLPPPSPELCMLPMSEDISHLRHASQPIICDGHEDTPWEDGQLYVIPHFD